MDDFPIEYVEESDYESMQEYARACKSVQEYAKVWKSKQKYAEECKSMEE